VRSSLPTGLLAGVFIFLCSGASIAQAPAHSQLRHRHPWARFEPGAWKLVRVVTESFDGQGALVSTSTTETRTTLRQVDAEGVTLLVEVVVEIGGRRLDGEPQLVRQGYYGEIGGQQVVVTNAGEGVVTIEGRDYPCTIEQSESTSGTGRTVTRTYYSPTVPPYALKQESITTELQTQARLSENHWQVTSFDVPCRILKRICSAAQVTATHRHPNGTTTTVAITSTEVPGGVICHNAREFDNTGRLVRRSTLETVAYGLDAYDGRAGLWRVGRPWHRHRTHVLPGR